MDEAISASELKAALLGGSAPLVIDVRKTPAFRSASEMITPALRRDPSAVAQWSKSIPRAVNVVVYCVHGHEVSQGAAKALRESGIAARYLADGIEEGWKPAGGALIAKPKEAATRWVTRERPKIDRIACPWLVTRFLDPDAEFLYVPNTDVRRVAKEQRATAYDIPDVLFAHDGAQCSFDAFLKTLRLENDSALNKLALIVRGADTGRLELAPQAAGLLAISQGLSCNFSDDYEMLRHGMTLYDALYAWCAQGQDKRLLRPYRGK